MLGVTGWLFTPLMVHMRNPQVLLVLCSAVLFACSSGNKTSDVRRGSGGTAGPITGASGDTSVAGGDAAGGTGIQVNIDAGSSDAGAVQSDWPSDLAQPWQYTGAGAPSYKDPTLPADVATKFSGAATATGAPVIAYPLDHSLHPNNLLDLTFQWTNPARASVFRIQASSGSQTYQFFVPCGSAQCSFPMPKSEWFDLGRKFGGQGELAFTVSAVNSAGQVATSAAVNLSFSPEPLVGALYYWASSVSQIKRATFGSDHAVPFIEPSSDTSGFPCVSCHSVSRDGKVIAFAVAEKDAQHGSAIRVAPTADPTHPYVQPIEGASPFSDLASVPYSGWAATVTIAGQPTQYLGPTEFTGNMVSLNSDGTLAAVVGLDSVSASDLRFFFELRDARTGSSLDRREYSYLSATTPNRFVPIMPEWSPDGKSIVVTLADNSVMEGCIWSWNTCKGSIAIQAVAGNKLSGEPQVLVAYDAASAINHFYPTWSPDGNYIAFASAKMDPAIMPPGQSYDNRATFLRLVKAQGGPYTCPGAGCWELTRGTRYAPTDATTALGHSTWPKFTPFAQGADKNLLFISFTSRLPYGFDTAGNSQLWMFGLDLSKLAAGSDPSYAPIWLPYQDLTDLSLNPYWAETLPCQSAAAGGCQGCVTGEHCTVDTKNQCQCVADVVK